MQRFSRWAPWLTLLAECVLLTQAVRAKHCSRSAEPSVAVQAPALPSAHSHNDYEQTRPLLDALDRGFTSVEADVWLVNDRLLIGHTFFQLDADTTFESEYLEPLARRVAAHGGRVYDDWQGSVQLLVDVKTDAEATYRAIERALARHEEMLTRFVAVRAEPGPVSVVISGNRPRSLMTAQRERLAAYDGRLEDMNQREAASFMPLISARWDEAFRWHGEGAMPERERTRLHELVASAHAGGQRLRFWGTPEDLPARDAVWSELVAAGVDYVNTDDLPALRSWFDARTPGASVAAAPVVDVRRINAAGM
jgi:glycerophosphoryl diester phosphodiesterase family protein